MNDEILTKRNTVPIAGFNSRRWQRDMQEARCLQQVGAKLPRHLWAALIAEQSGIYCHKFSITKTHCGEASVDDRLEYFSVGEIADYRNVWFLTIGRERMLKAILLLDSEDARETALEAAGGLAYTELPVQQRVQQLIAQYDLPAEVAANLPGKREPLGNPGMSEQPEVFAAELARLRIVDGGMSEKMLSGFFGGEE